MASNAKISESVMAARTQSRRGSGSWRATGFIRNKWCEAVSRTLCATSDFPLAAPLDLLGLEIIRSLANALYLISIIGGHSRNGRSRSQKTNAFAREVSAEECRVTYCGLR
jgi:hypothetical protein